MKSFFAADDFAQVAELVGVVGLDNVVDAAGVAVVLKKKNSLNHCRQYTMAEMTPI